MTNLLTLVKMQLKERMDFKRFAVEGVSTFKILLSILMAILKFALVTGLCAAVLLLAQTQQFFSMTRIVPASVISIVFSVMLISSIVSATVGLTRALYFSHDNAILLTLPCRPVQVYLSKLLIFFIYELKRGFTFTVPLFVAYFITHGYGFPWYWWLLVCFFFLSLFTVGLASVLSIPAMYVANLFRQFKTLQAVTMVVGVAGVTVALFGAISLIPESIDFRLSWGATFGHIQSVLGFFTEKFSLLYGITLMIVGEVQPDLSILLPAVPTLLRFLALIGASAVFMAGGLLIVRPLFYKMASKPFEHIKRRVRPHHNHVLPRPVSVVWTETLKSVKTPAQIFFNVGVLISIPVLIYLLNKIFVAMNTRAMGDYMILAFNALIILLIALNANTYAASVFSRDGRSSYLIKTQPAKYRMLLQAKLIPNTVFMAISLTVTFVILLGTTPFGPLNISLLMLAIVTIYLAHLIYCAELDLMNPQTELYATVGASDSNPNETSATLTAFLIAFGVAAVLFLLMYKESGTAVFVKFALVGLAAVIWRIHLFRSKIKLYYKEK